MEQIIGTAVSNEGTVLTEQYVAEQVDKLLPELCGKGHEKVNGKCPKCGRPTEYTTDEEMIAKVDEYLKASIDEEYRLVKTEGDKSTTWENKLKVKLPTLDSFSLMLGINVDTLQEWRKDHKEFSVACKKIEVEQRKRLIDNGLSGQYVPMMAKFLLSANHGMAEKTQQDITSKGDKIDGLAVSFVKPKE